MYGKLFASMYDGSLAMVGPWEALVTFQQMIILADYEGFVDMTAEAISRRTIIPLEIIKKGILELERPDAQSRDSTNAGRRIERISDTRDWGWKILNYSKYRQIRSAEERREYMREYMRQKRGTAQAPNEQSKENGALRLSAIAVLQFLNEKTGRRFEPVAANIGPIIARLKQGSTAEDMRAVIAKKCREWKGDEKMAQFLRPKTLFNATNYANYKGELGAIDPEE